MQIDLKSNLVKRIIVAIIGGFLFLSMLFINKWTFCCLFLGINLLTILEFYTITRISSIKLLFYPCMFFSILLYCYSFLHFAGIFQTNFVSILAIIPPLIMIFGLFQSSIEKSFINIGYCLVGLIYVTLPFCFINKLSFFNYKYDFGLILSIFLLIWSNDTGAFFVGRYLGKHKLFEKISPKKTIEGALGGLLACILLGFVLSNFSFFRLKNWYLISPIVSITGIKGDLIASLLKRSLKIKDSSNFLPGHGGFLDRFDSIIIAFPFVDFINYVIDFLK